MVESALIKQLLEAGVHFGHQTKRWNPKMKPYIFAEKNGIYIIDLEQTATALTSALTFVRTVSRQGGYVLFVGTKKQAQEIVRDEALRCGMFYVNQRWLGGLLTNFQTVKKSVKRLNDLERMKTDGTFDKLSKKEVSMLTKEMVKLLKNLAGVRSMDKLPKAIFVIDSKKEEIAVKEAIRLKIPVVGLVDTNCDPDLIKHIIPGNDDAIKSIKLVTGMITEAVMAGRQEFAEGVVSEQPAAPVSVEAPAPAVVEAPEPAVESAPVPEAEEAQETPEAEPEEDDALTVDDEEAEELVEGDIKLKEDETTSKVEPIKRKNKIKGAL